MCQEIGWRKVIWRSGRGPRGTVNDNADGVAPIRPSSYFFRPWRRRETGEQPPRHHLPRVLARGFEISQWVDDEHLTRVLSTREGDHDRDSFQDH